MQTLGKVPSGLPGLMIPDFSFDLANSLLVAEKPRLEHVILMCIAVNKIDLSALEALEKANQALSELGIKLHLSEVKGPVMDKLRYTDFFRELSGNNYLSHNQAVEDLKISDADL